MSGNFIAVEGRREPGRQPSRAQLAAALQADTMLDPFDANPSFRELAMTDHPKAQDGAPRRAHTDGMALDAHTAADFRNQLIELTDQAVAATRRGGEPFLHD